MHLPEICEFAFVYIYVWSLFYFLSMVGLIMCGRKNQLEKEYILDNNDCKRVKYYIYI